MDTNTLTEAEAAQVIGWSTANLRSHRLRYEAEQLAASLSPDVAALLETVRHDGADQEPVVDGYEGPALFRPEGSRWGLTRHGLEVARRCGGAARRSPPPPAAIVRPGRVRYDRDTLLAWLAEHPRIAKKRRRHAKTWGYPQTAEALGIAVGTLRTMVSRAQVAQRQLDAGDTDPDCALARAIERCPPWVWSGSERRWTPKVVRAWKARRRPARDPLAREPDTSRGPLITEAQAQALMDLTPQTLVGYRARARAARRRIDQGKAKDRDARRADAHPPYVLLDGARWYHRRDVEDWLAGRQRKSSSTKA